MEISEEKKRELLDRLRAVMAKSNGGAMNIYRLRAMADKARVAREAQESNVRRIEHYGGMFKYTPVEPAPPVLATPEQPKPETAEKLAYRVPYRIVKSKTNPILELRKKWVNARPAGRRPK